MDATLAQMMDVNWWTGDRMLVAAGLTIFVMWIAKVLLFGERE